MPELDQYADAVLAVVEQIPPGRVMSYGQVAVEVGRSLGRGGPRQVAAVLRADGTLAPEVAGRQTRHLVAEGVQVRGDRVPRGAFLAA